LQNNVIKIKNLPEDFYSFCISMVQVTFPKIKKNIIASHFLIVVVEFGFT
jgi:hypothetical protein